MRGLAFLPLMLVLSCGGGPGSTPFEQDSLERLDSALSASPLLTVDKPEQEAVTLLVVFREFSRTPLTLHIVWRTPQAPTTSQLARFGGKRIKQYWDPQGRTPSTGGQLKVNGQLVEEELLALRLALARAAAQPQTVLPLN